MNPIVIGITGGTGSGKTAVSKAIFDAVPSDQIVVLAQDSYYKAMHHLTLEERKKLNYDHPLAFDNELLIEHILALRAGNAIAKPRYDFKIYDRTEEVDMIQPRPIIMVEGIMVLVDQELRSLMDIKVYVDTDPDVRVLRRMNRDIKERGRTLESVTNDYLTRVKPAHDTFIEPSKKYADIVIPEGGQNKVAINMLKALLVSVIKE